MMEVATALKASSNEIRFVSYKHFEKHANSLQLPYAPSNNIILTKLGVATREEDFDTDTYLFMPGSQVMP